MEAIVSAEIPPSHAEQARQIVERVYEADGVALPPTKKAELLALIKAGLQAALDEGAKDAIYHRDCRPNRRQAEAWRDDAKAMNDKWADEFAAKTKAEAHAAALADRLTRIEKLIADWRVEAEERVLIPLVASTAAIYSRCANELEGILALPQDGEART